MKKQDNRNNTRHECKSMGDVYLDSEVFRGPVIDVSDGIGVIIKNSPHIVRGALANIKVLEYKLEFHGEVVWAEALDFDFVRIGFKNTGNVKGSPAHAVDPGYEISVNESFVQEQGNSDGVWKNRETVALSGELAGEEENKTVLTYDKTDSGVTQDLRISPHREYSNTVAGSEKNQHRRKWPYFSAVIFLALLLVVGMAFLHDKTKKALSTHEFTVAKHHEPTSPVTTTYPSFRDRVVAKAYLDLTGNVTQYPLFHQDALTNLERE